MNCREAQWRIRDFENNKNHSKMRSIEAIATILELGIMSNPAHRDDKDY